MPQELPRPLVALGLAAVVALVAACGGGSSTSSKAATVDVRLADYKVTLSSATSATGDVTLAISNGGKETHELIVVKTDLPANALPTDESGDVSEDGAGLTFIDEREDISPGASTELPLHQQAGRYIVLCNLPGHYAKGMYAELTLEADSASSGSGASASFEDRIVPDSEVVAGLTSTKAALGALAGDLGADPAKAMVTVYSGWYAYEGTLRHTDQSTYLDLEDQLAAAKRAADAKDQAAMAAAAAKFASLADAYVQAHPG